MSENIEKLDKARGQLLSDHGGESHYDRALSVISDELVRLDNKIIEALDDQAKESKAQDALTDAILQRVAALEVRESVVLQPFVPCAEPSGWQPAPAEPEGRPGHHPHIDALDEARGDLYHKHCEPELITALCAISRELAELDGRICAEQRERESADIVARGRLEDAVRMLECRIADVELADPWIRVTPGGPRPENGARVDVTWNNGEDGIAEYNSDYACPWSVCGHGKCLVFSDANVRAWRKRPAPYRPDAEDGP